MVDMKSKKSYSKKIVREKLFDLKSVYETPVFIKYIFQISEPFPDQINLTIACRNKYFEFLT